MASAIEECAPVLSVYHGSGSHKTRSEQQERKRKWKSIRRGALFLLPGRTTFQRFSAPKISLAFEIARRLK
jgi:hypothetical protein